MCGWIREKIHVGPLNLEGTLEENGGAVEKSRIELVGNTK